MLCIPDFNISDIISDYGRIGNSHNDRFEIQTGDVLFKGDLNNHGIDFVLANLHF